jgi:hypothetical protein
MLINYGRACLADHLILRIGTSRTADLAVATSTFVPNDEPVDLLTVTDQLRYRQMV